MIEKKFTTLTENSFIKTQSQNSIKKKGAAPVGRVLIIETRCSPLGKLG